MWLSIMMFITGTLAYVLIFTRTPLIRVFAILPIVPHNTEIFLSTEYSPIPSLSQTPPTGLGSGVALGTLEGLQMTCDTRLSARVIMRACWNWYLWEVIRICCLYITTVWHCSAKLSLMLYWLNNTCMICSTALLPQNLGLNKYETSWMGKQCFQLLNLTDIHVLITFLCCLRAIC